MRNQRLPNDTRYESFPAGFFDRQDERDDNEFYDTPRLVTHIDDRAIAAVGGLYSQLGLTGTVLDVCGSWISHFSNPPDSLIVQGMNSFELSSNELADGAVVANLNTDAALPFADATFDGACCCVSVDYLTRPLEVFDEVARVLRPGSLWVHTFSNRCFPTKAIRGWLSIDDQQHMALVETYFNLSGNWEDVSASTIIPPGTGGDPLYAVSAKRGADIRT